MVTKKRGKMAVCSVTEVEQYLKANRAEFEKHKEVEKERERRTMERGMVYWINT